MTLLEKIQKVRFGILKRRFKFSKNFNNLHNHIAIDNAFVCCAMLHNMMLKADGCLDDNNPLAFPGVVGKRLAKQFGQVW